MGVVEIDHTAVKNRIQAILKADTKIYNVEINSGALVRDVWVGLPDGYKWESRPFPYLTITNDLNWETDKPYGAIVGTDPNANISTSYHTVRYMIIGMDLQATAATTEISLDAIHKETKTALKNNVKLTDPTNGTNDLKVIQSILGSSKYVDGGVYKGKNINGFIITLTAIIVS